MCGEGGSGDQVIEENEATIARIELTDVQLFCDLHHAPLQFVYQHVQTDSLCKLAHVRAAFYDLAPSTIWKSLAERPPITQRNLATCNGERCHKWNDANTKAAERGSNKLSVIDNYY